VGDDKADAGAEDGADGEVEEEGGDDPEVVPGKEREAEATVAYPCAARRQQAAARAWPTSRARWSSMKSVWRGSVRSLSATIHDAAAWAVPDVEKT
jgi:hypothetical protein